MPRKTVLLFKVIEIANSYLEKVERRTFLNGIWVYSYQLSFQSRPKMGSKTYLSIKKTSCIESVNVKIALFMRERNDSIHKYSYFSAEVT